MTKRRSAATQPYEGDVAVEHLDQPGVGAAAGVAVEHEGEVRIHGDVFGAGGRRGRDDLQGHARHHVFGLRGDGGGGAQGDNDI